MYVWDGEVWQKAHCWVLISAAPGAEAQLKIMGQGGASSLTAEEYARLEPDSVRDVARWMAEGSVHKVPAVKAGKEK